MSHCPRIVLVVSALTAVGLTGCFSSRPEDIQAYLKPYEATVTTDEYVLQPPDRIEIHCSKVPEIDKQNQRIRPDGKVSFEALGEIDVAGKTCQEVADIMEEKVAELYNLSGEHPVDVRVVVYLSKVYYVLGQVLRPGAKDYTGRDTVLTALADAQPNPMAWEERVQVVRPSADPNVRPRIFELNFDRMIAHGDASKDVLLQEGDIVYVPPTVFSAIAMKLEEVIRPIARAFSGVYMVESPAARGGGYYGRY